MESNKVPLIHPRTLNWVRGALGGLGDILPGPVGRFD